MFEPVWSFKNFANVFLLFCQFGVETVPWAGEWLEVFLDGHCESTKLSLVDL